MNLDHWSLAGGTVVDSLGGHKTAPRATLIFLVVGALAGEGWGFMASTAEKNIFNAPQISSSFWEWGFVNSKTGGPLVPVYKYIYVHI